VKNSDGHERDERQQLADGEHVQHQAALADAPDIDGGNREDDERDEGRTHRAGIERREVEGERRREDVDDSGPARDPGEPEHPPDFERREPAERRARVEVGAAGRIEAPTDFGEAQSDEQ
jgi:hypothetical protein